MRKKPVIALTGATGAVGRHVLKSLAPRAHVRAGYRHLPSQRLPNVEYHCFDLSDDRALRAFCRDADLIINCAAPGHLIGDSVARVAIEHGIDYLDPGGDDTLYAAVKGKIVGPGRCIVSAGMLPGLSGLLPRLLMSGMTRITDIQGYMLSSEPFSHGGAADFLASFSSNYGLAGLSLQQGTLQPCQVVNNCRLPLARSAAQALPFITSEWQRLAADYAIPQARWFNLFVPGEMTQWLNTRRSNNDMESDVEQLMALSLADCTGRPSEHVMAVEVSGEIAGKPLTRTRVVKVRYGSELTAAVTAYCAQLCLTQQLPSGLHYAAEILPPDETLKELQHSIPDIQLVAPPGLFAYEEGAL